MLGQWEGGKEGGREGIRERGRGLMTINARPFGMPPFDPGRDNIGRAQTPSARNRETRFLAFKFKFAFGGILGVVCDGKGKMKKGTRVSYNT